MNDACYTVKQTEQRFKSRKVSTQLNLIGESHHFDPSLVTFLMKIDTKIIEIIIIKNSSGNANSTIYLFHNITIRYHNN